WIVRPGCQARARGGRGQAGELPEVADEVGLIVVAEHQRELGPALAAAGADVPDAALEADQPGGELRRQADLLAEPGDQTLGAVAELAGERADVDEAAAGLDASERPRDLAGAGAGAGEARG